MSLAHISTVQALSVWAELEAAYRGDNGFGGNTAEIYVYTLMQNQPQGAPTIEELRTANRALWDLLVLFRNRYDVQITYGATRQNVGKLVQWWWQDNLDEFTEQRHRHHIRIRPTTRTRSDGAPPGYTPF